MSGPENPDAEVESIVTLNKVRKGVVYAALALLILSFVQRSEPLVYARAGLWAIAGVISVVVGVKLQKIGQPAGNAWLNAAIYFAVSVLPILAGR